MILQTLTLAGSQGSCLKMRLPGQVYTDLPRHPANVNAMKQNMCDI